MYEEKDWIMSQIKQIAKSLGNMLSKDSIKEILKFEQSDMQDISDEDIEKIISIIDITNKQKKLNLTESELVQTLGIDETKWNEINIQNRMPDDKEYDLIKIFLYGYE